LAFTLLSYALVLVGFASICAITARFQRHFQEVQERQHEAELETRELRIQVLESKIKSEDLRLQLLDQNLEKAQTRLNEAKGTIAEMESAIQYESSRNEELQENLRQAEAAKDEALTSIQDIEQDRERITKELKELEALREVEEMNYPEASRERTRRPKEYLWLNQVYRNLQFSRRALQNIIDLQNSPDIFPALPDALTTLNNSRVESLLNGGAIPSRSAVRYTQPLAHHYGDLWEYRFSKDGRLFFGLSKSRTWNIDTVLLKRKFSLNRHKYEKYLEQTLGKDNDDLTSQD
jgi:DNA repair exonuclease SbcCD ATPase subunit